MSRAMRFLCVLFLVALSPAMLGGFSPAAERVVLNLGFVPHGRDLGWYDALERGFYKAEGLDVIIVRGYGGGATAKEVAAGDKADFGGSVDTASVVLGQMKGLRLKIVLMNHDIVPFTLRTLEGSGINTLKDLEGRSIGTPAGDATWMMFPTLAKINGLDLSKLKVINIAPDQKFAMLASGKVDATTGFITTAPIVSRMTAKYGKKLKDILLANYGLDIYGAGLATKSQTLVNRGEMVRKFLRATVKGVADAIEHPDWAMDALIKHSPALQRTPNREVWDIAVDLWLTPAQKRLGIGWMTEEKWKRTRDIIAKANDIKQEIPLSDLYTNDYLPKILPPKRAPRAIAKLF